MAKIITSTKQLPLIDAIEIVRFTSQSHDITEVAILEYKRIRMSRVAVFSAVTILEFKGATSDFSLYWLYSHKLETRHLSNRRRAAWISSLDRKNCNPSQHSRVCSEHFLTVKDVISSMFYNKRVICYSEQF